MIRRALHLLCLIAGLLCGATLTPAVAAPHPAVAAHAWTQADSLHAEASPAERASPTAIPVEDESLNAVSMPDFGKSIWQQRPGQIAHAGGDGRFEVAQLLTTGAGKSSGGAAPPSFLPENRAASLALATDTNIAGDSIPFGVSVYNSGTNSYQNQLSALMSAGTINKNAVSGSAWNVPAWTGTPGNPNPITDKITGGANYATNIAMANGSVNGYNLSVVQGGATEGQAWVSYIQSGMASALAPLTQPWVYFLGPYAEAQGPGMPDFASWRYLFNQCQALYGGHCYDLPRALQFRGSQDQTTLDWKNVNTWGGLPFTAHGMPQAAGVDVLWTNAVLPTAWITCSASSNTPAQMAVSCGDPTLLNSGTLGQNLNTSAGILNVFRVGTVSGTKMWEPYDPLHLSPYSSTDWANYVSFDILAALQGAGAPAGEPATLFCAQDVAASGSCGTIYYIGNAAPASAALFDSTNTLVTTLSLSTGAPVSKYGSITVTRSAVGSLTEGCQIFTLQTTDASAHVIHSPVDFCVGQASTQTTPRLWLIPGTPGNESAAFTMEGLTAHGLDNGGKYWFAFYVKPVSIATTQEYVINLKASNSDLTSLQARISTGGSMNVIATNFNATPVLVMNTSTASVFANNQATWILCDVDFTVALPTLKCAYNKNGAGSNSTISATGITCGVSCTMNMNKTEPMFFATLIAQNLDENRGASPLTSNQFTGSFGLVLVGNGNTGIGATPSVANSLWNPAGGAPAVRACGATVGGQAVVFELGNGGIGDMKVGGCLRATSPVFGTKRGIEGLSLLDVMGMHIPANDNQPSLILAA